MDITKNTASMFEAPATVQEQYGKKYTVAIRTPHCRVGTLGKCYGADTLKEGQEIARLFGTVLSDVWGVTE